MSTPTSSATTRSAFKVKTLVRPTGLQGKAPCNHTQTLARPPGLQVKTHVKADWVCRDQDISILPQS